MDRIGKAWAGHGRARWAALAIPALSAACAGEAPPPADPPLTADPPAATGSATADGGAAAVEIQRGLAFVKMEKYADAKPHFERALGLKPNAEAAYYLGVCAEKTGDKAGAEAAYKKAMELDPKFPEPAQNLGALYLDDPPRPDEAIAVLKTAAARVPDNGRILQNLGYAYGLKGDVEGASKAYEAALAKGEDPQVRFAYGAMLFEARKLDKAAEQLKKALDGTRDDAPMLVTLGRLLGSSKAYADCVKAFDRAIKIKSTDPEWFVRRGTCRHELKDEPGAQADYEQAIKIDPKFAAGHFYLGMSYLSEKKRQLATIELEKAVKLGGDGPIGKAAKERLEALAKKK